MRVLALDIGSSSIKAALISHHRLLGPIARIPYPTTHQGVRVEVSPPALLAAIRSAVAAVPRAASADVVAFACMSPAWLAWDARARPLTPIITHQDRRSLPQARRIESQIGRQRHLRLAGNRPVPGAISSTTAAWFLDHHPALIPRIAATGHLSSYLMQLATGRHVIDPSNASFTGLYLTLTQAGWSDPLLAAAGIRRQWLPEILDAATIVGPVTPAGSRALALPAGIPILGGLTDTSAALLLAGTQPGQLVNVCGSTDVLALCIDTPRPDPRLITRALGTTKKWLAVATIPAAGSTIDWLRRTLFPDLTPNRFAHQLRRAAAARDLANSTTSRAVRTAVTHAQPASKSADVADVGDAPTPLAFDPSLAGSRTDLDPRTGSITGLTLATTRDDILAAAVASLATQSAARLSLLADVYPDIPALPKILISGGIAQGQSFMHRHWPPHLHLRPVAEATLLGLARLAESAT